MSDILNTAIAAAKEAGGFLLQNFGKVGRIEKKRDRDFATNLDKEAESLIIGRIKAKFPEHGIIAEESGKEGVGRDYPGGVHHHRTQMAD